MLAPSQLVNVYATCTILPEKLLNVNEISTYEELCARLSKNIAGERERERERKKQ